MRNHISRVTSKPRRHTVWLPWRCGVCTVKPPTNVVFANSPPAFGRCVNYSEADLEPESTYISAQITRTLANSALLWPEDFSFNSHRYWSAWIWLTNNHNNNRLVTLRSNIERRTRRGTSNCIPPDLCDFGLFLIEGNRLIEMKISLTFSRTELNSPNNCPLFSDLLNETRI